MQSHALTSAYKLPQKEQTRILIEPPCAFAAKPQTLCRISHAQ